MIIVEVTENLQRDLRMANRAIHTTMPMMLIPDGPSECVLSGSGHAVPIGTACVLYFYYQVYPPPALHKLSILSILLYKVVSAALTAARFPSCPHALGLTRDKRRGLLSLHRGLPRHARFFSMQLLGFDDNAGKHCSHAGLLLFSSLFFIK